MRVWDAESGRELTCVTHTERPLGVAFSPDGQHIASICADNTAHVCDSDGGRELSRVTELGPKLKFDNVLHEAHAVAFSPGGKQIATASEDGARLWEVRG